MLALKSLFQTHLWIRKYSALGIVAADVNEALLGQFREKLQKAPDGAVEVVHWHAGSASPPLAVQKCKSALIRLVLQHVADPHAFLLATAKVIGVGSPLFIIEEDDGFFQIEPELPAFRRTIQIWKEYVSAYAGERYMGRRIPRLVAEAGLHVENVRVLIQTNAEIGLAMLMDYFKATLRLIAVSAPAILSIEELRSLSYDIDQFVIHHQGRCFVGYPQIITVARVRE